MDSFAGLILFELLKHGSVKSALLVISATSLFNEGELGVSGSDEEVESEGPVCEAVMPTVGHRSSISASAEVKLSFITLDKGGQFLVPEGDVWMATEDCSERNRCLSSSNNETGVKLLSV